MLEDTICFKISRSEELLEVALKTKTLDVAKLAHYLHEIREDARRMESALKLRAKVMFEAGIEESYQKEKLASTLVDH